MNRIYIVGYMGAGKTTAAKRIATRLGWDVADTDAMFEEKYRISIHDFFNKYAGETYSLTVENTVISTGGGLACHCDNMEWMNRHGLTVFMRISPEAAADRILHSKRKRPLTDNKNEVELAEYIRQHYAERLPFYEQAQITVKSEDFDLDSFMNLIK